MLREIVDIGDWNNDLIPIVQSIRTGYAAQRQKVLHGNHTLLEAMKSSLSEGIVVDSLENGEVELYLRPNASLACRVSPTA